MFGVRRTKTQTQVYAHVEFCVSSGNRLNFALRAQNQWCQKPDGSWLKLSSKTLVDVSKVNGFFYAMVKGRFMQGLQAALPLSILTFGGTRATRSNSGILLDGLVHVSCNPACPETLLNLRENFVTLLSAFLIGQSKSADAAVFRRLL